MYTISAVRTVSITATGTRMKKTDARTTIGQIMKKPRQATGAVIGKGNTDEGKRNRSRVCESGSGSGWRCLQADQPNGKRTAGSAGLIFSVKNGVRGTESTGQDAPAPAAEATISADGLGIPSIVCGSPGTDQTCDTGNPVLDTRHTFSGRDRGENSRAEEYHPAADWR